MPFLSWSQWDVTICLANKHINNWDLNMIYMEIDDAPKHHLPHHRNYLGWNGIQVLFMH